MLYNAENGQLNFENSAMDYIKFGRGEKNIVMIPGLGDGVKTVKGLAVPMAFMYRQFARDFTVWVFSRKQPLAEDCTTRDMAADIALAMDMLAIDHAHIIGVSQGGMIAQWLAVDYPHKIDKLVLAVTMARPNETVQSVVGSWLEMVQKGDFKTMLIDNFEKSYTEKYLKKYRVFYPLIVPFMKPADSRRFIIQAKACLTHNAYSRLGEITVPVLIVAGEQDKILTAHASQEIADAIPDSRLVTYPDYGHAVYEEAADFNLLLLKFLQQ